MKHLPYLLLLLSLLFSEHSLSQDIISLKDGSSLNVKVVEISSIEVKYKKNDNQQGPTYTIPKATVHKIKYQNGTLDNFVSGDPSFGLTVEDLAAIFKKRASSNRLTNGPKVQESINPERYGLKNPSSNGIRVAGVDFTGGSIVSSKGRIDEIYVTKQLHFYDYLNQDKKDRVEKDIFGNVSRVNKAYKNEEPENETIFENDVNKLREYLILNYGSSFTIRNDGKESCWAIDDDASVCLFVNKYGKESLLGEYIPFFGGIDLTINKTQKKLQLEQIELEEYSREIENAKSDQITSIVGSTFVPDPSVNYDSLYYGNNIYQAGGKRSLAEQHADNPSVGILYMCQPYDNDLRINRNTTANPDIVYTVNNLKKRGVYHKVASKYKIELTDERNYKLDSVNFNSGGYLFNEEGVFKSVYLIKYVEKTNLLSKDQLKDKAQKIRMEYKQLVQKKEKEIAPSIMQYQDQYFLLQNKSDLQKFEELDIYSFIPNLESVLSVSPILLVLPYGLRKDVVTEQFEERYGKAVERHMRRR